MDYTELRIELPMLFFHCVIPSGMSELEAGRAIQYEARRAAQHIEDELFNRFRDEYNRQKLWKEKEGSC